jgi:hypothetical protein
MNKPLSLVLVLSVLASMGYAQSNNLDAEVDAELNQMYESSAKTPAAPQISTVTIPNESVVNTNTNSQTQSASASAVNSQPIYIVNQKHAAPAPQVQTQPTVTIEASPLIDSRAENLRRARQDAEMSTEAKIVEKLEQSRLEDEKRRAQVLFGDKLSGQNPEANQAPVAPQAPAPAPQPQIIIIPQQAPAPAPVAAPVVETKTEAAVEVPTEKEVEAAVKSELSMPLEVVPHVPVAQKYFSGLIGVSEIDSSAVQANYTLGFTYGTKYDDAYAVEGTFMYSNSEVENVNNQYSFYYGPQVNLFDMNQYSGSMAVKYFLLNGMVKPVIGGLGQYSYREFQWSDKNGYSRSLSRSSSHAFDIGALMGVEIEFSPKMKMGFDVRYLKNIAVNRDYSTDQLRYSGGAPLTAQQIADADFGYRTPIEELSAFSYTFNFTVNF